jgi:phosphohistidine swiveling domain-containing protein
MDVLELRDVTDITKFGGKAVNLAKMLQASFSVPAGLAVGLNAFGESGELKNEAKQLIKQRLLSDKLYAVRSSALAEDAEDASWAGQFETFLDTPAANVIERIEECHNSSKARVKAYAGDKDTLFQVAVVIQEMIKPEYAGVLFTMNPVTGDATPVTEYVEGLGEELVSGRADPVRIILDGKHSAPFDTQQLIGLASDVEQLFGKPQDIEWAWADNTMWLVQSRPITTTRRARSSYYLGEPEDLFYWGPARAIPMYMSDFMAGVEKFFAWINAEKSLIEPPKAIVMFEEGKMVWLYNAVAFVDFVKRMFKEYESIANIKADIEDWKRITGTLPDLSGQELKDALTQAWLRTEFAEFSLYGAEAVLTEKLSRLEPEKRQEVWGAFTIPDDQTFLARIDNELAESQDAQAMANKYPWITDGYDGTHDNAKIYFQKRLVIVGNSVSNNDGLQEKRELLTKELQLTDKEIDSLTLARQLAEFMDERKAWMMQTRRLITEPIGTIEHGWQFNQGKASLIDANDTHELWQRYINFKSSSNAVSGIVASNGGRHFINGEVVIMNSPTDNVEDGKIVVVPSTSPSYVPLMRKAKALVTDHGGMMSHAAIVAREFNLPCIVGTKHATKVLKDGDRVVLDLVKGDINK